MIDVQEAIKKLPRELPENLPDDAVVFAGDVAGFGPPPAAWSGRFAMYQTVKFTGVTALRGEVPKAFDVDVAVVKNSPLALEDTPGLSDEVLSRGTRWIVAAVEDEKRKVWALRYVSPWSIEREAAARKFLSDKPLKKKDEKDNEKK
ncbi:MAG: hypothetical protein DCC68_18590 [Planctomycetota bacterium]|nr:MAG: hypothetical protein DCC68_18590 [Planctomycetota bacterium]